MKAITKIISNEEKNKMHREKHKRRVSCSEFITQEPHSDLIVHILQCAHKKLYEANVLS